MLMNCQIWQKNFEELENFHFKFNVNFTISEAILRHFLFKQYK